MMKASMASNGHLHSLDYFYLWYCLPGLLPTKVDTYINHVLRVLDDTGIYILGIRTTVSNKTVRSSLSDLLPLTLSN
jgi:hypothetical protein